METFFRTQTLLHRNDFVLRAACRAAMGWSLRVYKTETAKVVRNLMYLHLADQSLEERRRSLGCECGECWIENLEDRWVCTGL